MQWPRKCTSTESKVAVFSHVLVRGIESRKKSNEEVKEQTLACSMFNFSDCRWYYSVDWLVWTKKPIHFVQPRHCIADDGTVPQECCTTVRYHTAKSGSWSFAVCSMRCCKHPDLIFYHICGTVLCRAVHAVSLPLWKSHLLLRILTSFDRLSLTKKISRSCSTSLNGPAKIVARILTSSDVLSLT